MIIYIIKIALISGILYVTHNLVYNFAAHIWFQKGKIAQPEIATEYRPCATGKLFGYRTETKHKGKYAIDSYRRRQ